MLFILFMINSKKSSSKSKKKTIRRKKNTKKIFIPAGSVIIMCATVVAICTALLVFSTFVEPDESAVKEKTPSQASAKPAKDKNSAENSGSFSKENHQNKELKKSEIKAEKKAENVQKEVKTEQKNLQTTQKSYSSDEENKKIEPPLKSSSEKSVEKTKVPSDIPEIPVAKNNARLAIIFDDGGQSVSQLEKCISLPFPVTVAVLPKLQYSKKCAQMVRSSGNELILHQPMQALNLNVNPGEGAIKPEMSLSEISSLLQENIKEIGPVKGLNNHEGSLISEDEARIGEVLKTASDLGIYFLDSRTTSQSRVPQAAMSMGYSYYQRNIFLDNTKNRSDIIAEILKGLAIANKNGAAIMIGHVWSADVLPKVLSDMYPILVQKGYKFVAVSNSGALITP